MNKHLLALFLSLSIISMSAFAGGGLVASFNISVNSFAKNQSSNVIYATTSNNSVVIVDMTTLTITDTIFVGSSPAGLAVAPDGQTLYVALTGAYRIAVVDLTTKTVSTINIPAPPFDVEVGNGYLYATPNNQNISGIMQINLTTHAVTDFSGGVSIYTQGLLEISQDKNSLYFANKGLSPGTLAKYDISVNPPNLLYQNPHGSLGSNGQDLSLTADGQHIYYAVGSGNGISGG
jgi:YVTN family beta-propeller protein